MASDTAPGDGESRLYELLEKILQAVTRLNENVESFSKATTRMGSCNTTQDISRDRKLCHDK
ncbi:hypothetical protein BTJ68_00783 [Hortaea werneckii EXF-2000]|uniref:Uncharacterized protein n=1 Tax=Hortaea werneckii EXF-2000 TaxID=1157616 RepID=A0A1Z5TTP7_HORWE|nr:hypothetical protein BTJ68_00783 [Hortaea werneckii EXF-2000]